MPRAVQEAWAGAGDGLWASDADAAAAGIMNQAVMTSLQPGVRYFYVYGDVSMGTSRERSFVMGPAWPRQHAECACDG